MKQINKYGTRYYFDEVTGKIYISSTSFCKAVLPTSEHLIEWRVKYGHYESRRMAKERADYGTLMHNCIEVFLGEGMMTMQRLEDTLWHYCEVKGYEEMGWRWLADLKNDMLAFAQFAYDKRLDPIELEKWVWKDIDESGGVAGTVDFYGKVDFRGKPKVACLDWKSGRKGFWESHELQLQLYKWITGAEMCFNWAPKNWRADTPTYGFKNQTDSPMGRKLPHYLEIAIEDSLFTVNVTDKRFDNLVLGHAPEFQTLNIHEILQEDIKSE